MPVDRQQTPPSKKLSVKRREEEENEEEEEDDVEYVPDDDELIEEDDEEYEDEDENYHDDGENEISDNEYDENPGPSTTPHPSRTLKYILEKKKLGGTKKSPAINTSTVTPRKRKIQANQHTLSVDNPSRRAKTNKKTKLITSAATSQHSNIVVPTSNTNLDFQDSAMTDKSEEQDEKDEKKDGKKIEKKYNDKNVDFNLYNEAPENIVNTKVKVSSTCMIISKMIEANGEAKGLTYDMAALVIARKLKNGGIFEFTLPLNLAPNIVQALTLIMEKNKHFFEKKPLY